jgi:hypothetical protein
MSIRREGGTYRCQNHFAASRNAARRDRLISRRRCFSLNEFDELVARLQFLSAKAEADGAWSAAISAEKECTDVTVSGIRVRRMKAFYGFARRRSMVDPDFMRIIGAG